MDEKLIKIEPEIEEETVFINAFHNNKYLLAFLHNLKSKEQKDSHFLPIEFIEED